MTKFFTVALTAALLVASAMTLSACNTTAGAGKDVAAVGNAVTDTAHKATQ